MAKDFTLEDFRRQLVEVEKRGMKDLCRHMPGLSATDEEDQELVFRRIRQMIDAMTDEERSNPDIIDSSRRSRIATTSGTQPSDVEGFLAQFDQVRALMREMASMSLWQRMQMVAGFGKLPRPDGGA